MYYKVLMEAGHMGAGKSFDVTRYFRTANIASLFDLLSRMPRIKKKGLSRSVKQIVPVSKSEFIRGKHGESQDPYLCR